MLKPSQCIRPSTRACSTLRHRSITTASSPRRAISAPSGLITPNWQPECARADRDRLLGDRGHGGRLAEDVDDVDVPRDVAERRVALLARGPRSRADSPGSRGSRAAAGRTRRSCSGAARSATVRRSRSSGLARTMRAISTGSWYGVPASAHRDGPESHVEIPEQVVEILEAYRETNRPRADSRAGELLVGRAGDGSCSRDGSPGSAHRRRSRGGSRA